MVKRIFEFVIIMFILKQILLTQFIKTFQPNDLRKYGGKYQPVRILLCWCRCLVLYLYINLYIYNSRWLKFNKLMNVYNYTLTVTPATVRRDFEAVLYCVTSIFFQQALSSFHIRQLLNDYNHCRN